MLFVIIIIRRRLTGFYGAQTDARQQPCLFNTPPAISCCVVNNDGQTRHISTDSSCFRHFCHPCCQIIGGGTVVATGMASFTGDSRLSLKTRLLIKFFEILNHLTNKHTHVAPHLYNSTNSCTSPTQNLLHIHTADLSGLLPPSTPCKDAFSLVNGRVRWSIYLTAHIQ